MFSLEKSILHVLVSKKNSPKFRPNFAKFGSFGGGRNFCNTEIENPGCIALSCSYLLVIFSPAFWVSQKGGNGYCSVLLSVLLKQIYLFVNNHLLQG